MALVVLKTSDMDGKALTAEDNRLGLNCDRLYLAEGTERDVRLSWNFSQPVNLIDWIGMFEVEECNPLHYMDYKSYGVCGPRQGSTSWSVSATSFANRPSTLICFRYFDGLTGALRATSPPLLVYTAARIVIDGISCKQLPCKNGAIYAKVRCGSCCYRTNTSESATWTNLHFLFAIDRSRELQLSIKERSWPGDRTVGEINIPVADLAMHASQEMAFVLRPTNVTKSFDCHVLLSVRTIPESGDTLDEEGNVRHTSVSPSAAGAISEDRLTISGSSTESSLSRSDGASTSSGTARRPLPEGWEARVDRHGRVFYLDHTNRRTTWDVPELEDNDNVPRVYKRYACARRTIVGGSSNHTSTAHSCTLNGDFPPVKFLQRSDFVTLLHSNQAALQLYNESSYLKHIIHRIRRDAINFDRFKQNRELVDFLNLFADQTQPLPNGWQMNEHLDNQRVFVDHNGRRTTLIDPRLPICVKRRAKSAPAVRHRQHDHNGNNMLDVVHRSAELQALVRKRLPESAPRLCRKLQIIAREGRSALARFANDIELISALSLLESEVASTPTDFDDKLSHFYGSLQRSGYGQGPGKTRLRLRRAHLVNDAFEQLLSLDSTQLRKNRICVTFDEEDGLDYGGPSRELFFLLSRELFNPYYGLFEYSANDTYTVQISPMSIFVDSYLQWMELCGRVLGLALVHRCLIESFFTRAFYKFLLEMPYAIGDLQSMDSQFHNSLLWIKENEITPEMELTFSTTQDVGGEIVEVDLLPNGKELLVTEDNKEEFLTLLLKWRVERGVVEQGKALLRGLHQVIDRDFLRIFDGEQLELILSGTVEIDLEDWRENTEYKGGYYPEHVCIAWFWNSVYAMTNADRLKLLQFVTGTSSIPYEGFRALRGSTGPKKFTIEKWGSEESLPRAHTCFNRLDLPPYSTQQKLNAKLRIAINESISYAIE